MDKLIRRGHSLEAVSNYTLSQFMVFLKIVEQNEASERLNFVSDLSAVVGSLFSKDSPIKDHVASLVNHSAGIKDHGD